MQEDYLVIWYWWSDGDGFIDINRYDDPSEGVAHDVDHVIFMVVSHGTYGVLFWAFSCSVELDIFLVYHGR